MSSRATWSLRSAVRDQAVTLDGILIIFHSPSGKTHFLNSTSADIVDLLDWKSASFSEICDALSEGLATKLSPAQIQQIEHHIARLEALGLVERSLL